MTFDQAVALAPIAISSVRQLLSMWKTGGTKRATDVLEAMEAIFGAVDDAVIGKVTPDDMTNRIISAMRSVRTVDEEMDALKRKIFSTEDGET
jgi:uncharacterized membrane-anchored protein